jgi:hypothetical protein
MSIETINVTRWLNSGQEFIEVGTLFRDDSLGRDSPFIGFSYHPDYLESKAGLLPSTPEFGPISRTILNDQKNKDMVPNYFKQFLPSERNKSVINSLSDEFNQLDQFQQLKYLTKFRGSFGAVQLDYDSESQCNRLPKLDEAMALLSQLEKGNYNNLDNNALSAMYHPNADTHVVNIYLEVSGKQVYCNLRKCKSERQANEYVFVQNMMNECGIDSPLTVKLEDNDGGYYVGQMTGEMIIDKGVGVSAMYNTIPVAVLLADTKHVSKFENVNFAHINKAVSSSVGEIGPEIFKRALFTHLFAQKDISPRQIKIREVMDGKWKLAPHEICEINLDKNIPFNLSITDTSSTYTALKINEPLIEMVSAKYSLKPVEIRKAIDEVASGVDKLHDIAIQSGLTPTDIHKLSQHVAQSSIQSFSELTDEHKNSQGPVI